MASIRQRPDGKWRARYRDDTGKEHAKHFDRKRDADAWLVDRQAEMRAGTWVDPKNSTVTLASFYKEWGERQVWAENTAINSEMAVRLCTFKDIEFGKLRRSHVEAWVKSMFVAGLAATTIKTRVIYIRTPLKAAVRDRLLSHDPTDGVTLPRLRRAEQSMRIPTSEEVGALRGAAEEWFKPYVALCAFAGLRQGEASGVQLGDINFLKRELRVTRQIQRAPAGAIRITPPKFGSERTVFLPDELLEMIAHHVETIGVRGDEQWLFVGRNGLPPAHHIVTNWWQNTRAAAKLPDVRLHDMRHYFASGLIAAGCDVVTVQKALGHSNATTTLSTYSHLWPSAADKTRAASADLMRGSAEFSADQLRTTGA